MSDAWDWGKGAVSDAWGTTKGIAGDYLDPENHFNAAPTKVDPNAYQYGGVAGGAQAAQDRLQGMSGAAEARKGPSVYSADYKGDRRMDAWDRTTQSQSLDLARQAALGNAPSVAQLQMQAGLGQAVNAQQSLAAGARGGGANLAAAQRQAAMQGAQLAGQTNQQSGMLRAQEMADARGQYMQGANAIRGADQARASQSGQMGVAQAGATLQNQGQNDTRSLGLEGLGVQIGTAQLNAQQQGQAQQSQNDTNAAQINSGVAAGNTGTRKEILGTISSGFADSMSKANGGSGTSQANPPGFSSDMTMKKNVEGASGLAGQALQRASETIGGAQPISYNYREGDGGRVLGTSAQQLARGPMGDQVVQRDKGGKLAVNIPGATSMLLASGADQEHRLRAIEQAMAPAGRQPTAIYRNGNQIYPPSAHPPPEFISQPGTSMLPPTDAQRARMNQQFDNLRQGPPEFIPRGNPAEEENPVRIALGGRR